MVAVGRLDSFRRVAAARLTRNIQMQRTPPRIAIAKLNPDVSLDARWTISDLRKQAFRVAVSAVAKRLGRHAKFSGQAISEPRQLREHRDGPDASARPQTPRPQSHGSSHAAPIAPGLGVGCRHAPVRASQRIPRGHSDSSRQLGAQYPRRGASSGRKHRPSAQLSSA